MKKIYFLLYLVLINYFLVFSKAQIRLSTTNFNFGKVENGFIIKNSFKIKNNGNENLNINIKPSCDCLTASNYNIQILPDEIKEIFFEFDTKDYSGFVEVEFLIFSNDEEFSIVIFKIFGEVLNNKNIKNNNSTKIIENNNNTNQLYIYTYLDCSICKPIINDLLKWGEKNNTKIIINDLLDNKNKEFLIKIINEKKITLDLPFIVYNDIIYSGKKDIYNFINNNTDKINNLNSYNFNVFFIFLAGILDGINPCAFTAIILLISYLTIQLRKRKIILLAGLFYILSVFFTYFLIGVGIFEFIRKLYYFNVIKILLKYGLSILLLILAILSFIDFIKSLQGKNNEIILKLPDFFQKKIREKIRLEVKDYKIIISSLVLGFFISTFELVCTGQVYLPVLGYLVRKGEKILLNLVLLFTYNIGFIIPLTLIFILIYIGISSKKIGDFFSNKIWLVKFLFFIFFLLFSIINIILIF